MQTTSGVSWREVYLSLAGDSDPCGQFVIVEPLKLEVAVEAIPTGQGATSAAETWECTSFVNNQTVTSTVELEPATCGRFVNQLYGKDACQKVVASELPSPLVFRPLQNATGKAPMGLIKINKKKLLSSYIQVSENLLLAENSVIPVATFFSADIVHSEARLLFSELF